MTSPANILDGIVAGEAPGGLRGLPSFCTANPTVLGAVLGLAARRDLPILVEATCNQVNQEGGYTGQTPTDFLRMLRDLARVRGVAEDRLILGGDHLGPNPWRKAPAETAMDKAERLVADYCAAGFTKIHLDASMALGGEPQPSPETVARRCARLAKVAEAAAPDAAALRYVIGTEVPTPGGEADGHEVKVTTPGALEETVESHRQSFAAAGLDSAFEKVRAVVVQPGVDFSVSTVRVYDPPEATDLVAALPRGGGMIFEAHSTDYQPDAALAGLVGDRFGLLKVGPELTFAYREAIYALDRIEALLIPEAERGGVVKAVLAAMHEKPGDWQDHYTTEDPRELRQQMLFSYSDRIRYYWPVPKVEARLETLLANLPEGRIPRPLISQFLPGALALFPPDAPCPDAGRLVTAHVARVAARYYAACAAREGVTG